MTPQELHDWKKHPGTVEMLEKLDEEASRLLSLVVGGSTLDKKGLNGTDWHVGALYGLSFINTIQEDIREEGEEEDGGRE